jgi:trans-aconitate methyltransferase
MKSKKLDLEDSWNNPSVFKKQLELNISELSSPQSYPPHWNDFIRLVKHFKPKTILDVGCGCGALSEICNRHLDVEYTGVDYSSHAIDLAKKQWSLAHFLQKDYKALSRKFINSFDLLHLGALLDVLPDGDEALSRILSLSPKSVLIGRMKHTESPSFYNTYAAYGEIETYEFHHNREKFYKLCHDSFFSVNKLEENESDSYYLVNEKTI